jgi:hypothetical protein
MPFPEEKKGLVLCLRHVLQQTSCLRQCRQTLAPIPRFLCLVLQLVLARGVFLLLLILRELPAFRGATVALLLAGRLDLTSVV